MVSQQAGSTSVTNNLDPLARVASSSAGGVSTDYAYLGLSEDAVRVSTSAGSATTDLSYGPGGPMGISDANGRRVVLSDLHADLVGELKVQTGDFQRPAWFSPYGERSALDASDAPGMLGYQGDPTTQASADSPVLVDMTARNYAPELGRFTTADILSGKPRDPMSMNRWAYAEDDPLTFNDPTGNTIHCPPDGCPPPDQQHDPIGTGGDGLGGAGGGTSGGAGDPHGHGGFGSPRYYFAPRLLTAVDEGLSSDPFLNLIAIGMFGELGGEGEFGFPGEFPPGFETPLLSIEEGINLTEAQQASVIARLSMENVMPAAEFEGLLPQEGFSAYLYNGELDAEAAASVAARGDMTIESYGLSVDQPVWSPSLQEEYVDYLKSTGTPVQLGSPVTSETLVASNSKYTGSIYGREIYALLRAGYKPVIYSGSLWLVQNQVLLA